MMKVGSLFAGIGGIELGFEQSGFKTIWANEIDKGACTTYRYNFSDVKLFEEDIRKLDVLKQVFLVSRSRFVETKKDLLMSAVIYFLR